MHLLLAALLAAAPAPHRPDRPFRLPCGGCLMTYCGETYLAHFGAGGAYRAETLDGQRQWVGTWRLDGDALVIDERPAPGRDGAGWQNKRIPLRRNPAGAVVGPGFQVVPH